MVANLVLGGALGCAVAPGCFIKNLSVRKMKVLIACEESQAVCKEFRRLGHEAFSCDVQECSGGHPEWHIQGDVLAQLNKGWDLMIGFPPCTHLANAGGRWFEEKRKDGRQKDAIIFFMKLLAAPIPQIVLENPNGILGSDWYIKTHFPELLPELSKVGMPRKSDQVIQPFYFGDPVRKFTNLWLKNLPPLTWSKNSDLFTDSKFVLPEQPTKEFIRKGPYRTGQIRKVYWWDLVDAKTKAKTFPGVAAAMAEQWGGEIFNKATGT